jgi:hypothetical protein
MRKHRLISVVLVLDTHVPAFFHNLLFAAMTNNDVLSSSSHPATFKARNVSFVLCPVSRFCSAEPNHQFVLLPLHVTLREPMVVLSSGARSTNRYRRKPELCAQRLRSLCRAIPEVQVPTLPLLREKGTDCRKWMSG